jgi:hypothetical protein
MQISPSFVVEQDDDDDHGTDIHGQYPIGLWMEKKMDQYALSTFNTSILGLGRTKAVLLLIFLIVVLTVCLGLVVAEMKAMNAKSQEMVAVVKALMQQAKGDKGHRLCVILN